MSGFNRNTVVSIDQLVGPMPEFPERMAFEAVRRYGPMALDRVTVGQLCVKLSEAVSDGTLEGMYWRPGDVVRAALDGPASDSGHVGRVHAAAKLALGMYAGRPSEEHFDDMVARFKSGKVMDMTIEHQYDMAVDESTSSQSGGDKSFVTSEHIRRVVADKALLFLPVWRGVVAGMHVFLHHQHDQSEAERGDTVMYPLRQRGKLGPAMRDLHMLRQHSEGRTVVVFDVGAGRDGADMAYTVGYLKRELETDAVLGFVNKDHRWPGFNEMMRQGQYWERVPALPGRSSVPRALY